MRHMAKKRSKKKKKGKTSNLAKRFVAEKISKVNHDGVRGHPPAPGQAIAIALDEARRRGMKVPPKRS